MKYIYLITSPTGKQYIGKCTVCPSEKAAMYQSAKLFWSRVSDAWKQQRALNCSKGQKQRYAKSQDSALTKKRKSDAHKGTYKIESPDGRSWITTAGLKDFAEQHKEELNITYWALFSAYRKCYNNTVTTVNRKNLNQWKVTRIDATA